MNFSEQSISQDLLPGFSELNSRAGAQDFVSNDNDPLSMADAGIYTTVADNGSKGLMVNSPHKYSNSILAWPDSGALIQMCSDSKQNHVQAINIPVYNQSDAISIKTVSDVYLPQMDAGSAKNDDKDKVQEIVCSPDEAEALQTQSLVMQEYLQKLQSSTLPLTLQQLIKIQNDQAKKDKVDEEQKNDNILNIPSVPSTLIGLNPSDVNVHYEESAEQANQNHLDAQKDPGEGPKTQGKKFKFKAKTGEIKVTIGLDGSTLYCCPECSLVFAHKPDIEAHLQVHIQERKYQCKECGAMLKRKEHLDQHMRGHSDERPFKCPVCSKGFKRNEHLTRHYVIHSGDKNFMCTVCQKAFSRKDHLTKHSQTHLGIKKSKVKKEVIFLDTKDIIINNQEKGSDSPTISREEINSLLKESNFFKQDSTILHHIQNLQKETNYMQSFSAFKEHILKDSSTLHQQAVNMNEILPQNTRYLMPS